VRFVARFVKTKPTNSATTQNAEFSLDAEFCRCVASAVAPDVAQLAENIVEKPLMTFDRRLPTMPFFVQWR
jgi:hypothetical protein